MTDKATPEERLSAWLDGAMTPDEARAFEAELERDPALAERAATWRANDSFISGALAPLADEPIDADLLAKMGLAEPQPMPTAANDNPVWWRRSWLPVGGALAAGLALVLVLTPRPDAVPQDGGLSLALETTPALKQARLADGRMIEPVLTARAADGRWCREYRLADQTGIACRTGQGWKVEAEGKTPAPQTGGDIQLAGGAGSAAIDAAHARLGTADPLDTAGEQALIAKGWGDR
ncbi:MAG: anti-sigma factor family protein [Novosphingobium sp.]